MILSMECVSRICPCFLGLEAILGHGGWLASGFLEDLCLLLYSEVRVNWNDSCINIISCLIGSQVESLIDLDELSYDPLVSSGLDLSTIQSFKISRY